MADIAKVITVIGNSPESFAKAADAAVQEAAKTVRGISGLDVISMSADVQDGRITSYATAAGSPPCGPSTNSARARCAQISSCSSAAARKVSPAATTTE